MSLGLLILILVLIVALWGGGFYYGPGPIRGNNLVHVLLVLALVLIILHVVGVVRLRG